MNHWQRKPELRAKAWDYLRDELRADIALVQEAAPPADAAAVYRPLDATNHRLNWGSAVVSFRPDLTLKARPRIPLADCYTVRVTGDQLPDSHPGACAVADVIDSAGRFVFTAVSLYGLWEATASGRMYSCARLHRMLSDLTGVLAASQRRPVFIAGDFNVTTQVAFVRQTQADTDGAIAAFARLKAWGMTDCFEATKTQRKQLQACDCPGKGNCAHVRTFRLRNRADSRPLHLDYAFVSTGLVSKLQRCDVDHSDTAWSLSDHCPVVIDLS